MCILTFTTVHLDIHGAARRWLSIGKEPTEEQVAALMGNAARIAELRRRLSNLSWFLRLLDRSVVKLCPVDERNGGFLPLNSDDYLSLLDSIVRLRRSDKPGQTPAHLSPLFERLGLVPADFSALAMQFPSEAKIACG